ncbi:MAG TPA: hypothetical protein ENH41_01115 [Candidatus Omnitrophica bacterium]|nr:hypothetical protein [Candidatus Omnitrophota bacterium]
MNNKVMERLEILEEEIENLKWMVVMPFSFKKANASKSLNIIKNSSGILDKSFSKGTTFENKTRGEWKANFLKRKK